MVKLKFSPSYGGLSLEREKRGLTWDHDKICVFCCGRMLVKKKKKKVMLRVQIKIGKSWFSTCVKKNVKLFVYVTLLVYNNKWNECALVFFLSLNISVVTCIVYYG